MGKMVGLVTMWVMSPPVVAAVLEPLAKMLRTLTPAMVALEMSILNLLPLVVLPLDGLLVVEVAVVIGEQAG
ncbi:unnamed protein product [marine sediment metagenome]|uniref:Uncharacterized protein n=1 Tax=marine sediment metagenome TaxID=412755 RepID=X0S9X7_9ZZZZ